MEITTKKLFHKDFVLVVIGQIISLFGNAILRFALPLYLLRETGSSSLFGMVTACSFIPMIVLSLIGGVLADRVNKRNIMVILDFSTAALIVAFYVALGRVPTVPLFIAMLMLLYGISGTYQPAVQASIPAMVPQEKLVSGNAIINQVSTLASLLGPVIGGMLFGMWGIQPILLISIVCFTFSAVMEIFIHIPFVKQPTTQGVFSIVKGDLKESFRFVRQEKPIFFSAVLLICLFNLLLSALIIVGIPVMVVQTLRLSDELLGVTQGVLAFGGLAGGILTAVVGEKIKMHSVHWFLVLCSLCVAVIGVAFYMNLAPMAVYGVLTVMGFIAMAVSSLFSIQVITAVQQQTPPQMVGKIMAVLLALAMCAQPVGQAAYGVLFDVLHDKVWVLLVGAAAASLLLSLYSKRIFIKLEKK